MTLRIRRAFAVIAALLFPALAQAASPAPLATPNSADYSFTSSGSAQTDIRLSGIDGQGRVYLSGVFDAVNGVNMPGLARIAPDGALDTTWIPALPPAGVVVPGMVVPDAAGRLVVLHSDGKIYRLDPTNGSAVLLTLAPVPNMEGPCPDQPRTLAVDSANSDIYVACYSLTIGIQVGITPPQGAFAHVYRIDGTTALQDPAFDLVLSRNLDCTPSTKANVAVLALAHDGAGHLYVAGHFTSPQAGLFRVGTPSGTVDIVWRPAAPPPGVIPCMGSWTDQLFVTSIALSPGDVAYVAGFLGGGRVYLGRVSTLGAGAADGSWVPAVVSQTRLAPVISLALDPLRNRLYEGALFTDSSGNPQPYLRALSTLPGALLDAAWDPQPDGQPLRLYVDRSNERLVVGGDFTSFAGVSRNRVAALPLTGDTIMSHYYQSVLGRAPDASGAAFWPGEVIRVTSRGVNANEVYIAMAELFFSSPEFNATPLTDAQFVDKLYLTFFNRAADDGGRSFWVDQISQGLTREMVMFAFVFSPEFDAYMASNLIASGAMRPEVGVVIDFYRGALGRLPDNAGLSFWVNQYRAAQCAANPGDAIYSTTQAMADSFFTSTEYTQSAPPPTAYVSDLYNAFMRRSADVSGYLFWVEQIAGGGATQQQARAAFVSSPEFNARVQAIAAAGCVAPMP